MEISKKSFLIEKNRFLVKLRHFYNTYLNIVKNFFSREKDFFCDSAGWTPFKGGNIPETPWYTEYTTLHTLSERSIANNPLPFTGASTLLSHQIHFPPVMGGK